MAKSLPKGHISCLDPSFKYVRAAQSDIRKTFARMKRAVAEEQKQQEEASRVVTPIKRRKNEA